MAQIIHAQADLGLHCPHLPDDTFSHGAVHVKAADKACQKISNGHGQNIEWSWAKEDSATTVVAGHYENTPIQIYWNFYHQKMKIFR